MTRSTLFAVLVCVAFASVSPAAELGMGFRVGEVTQNSAIVWTRVTRDAERVWVGYREPNKRPERRTEYVPSEIPVADREGEIVGAQGEVRVLYGPEGRLGELNRTEWARVDAGHDFIHQFSLTGLQPATTYEILVEARDVGATERSASVSGSFGTPAEPDEWQDVSFGVVTGQSYWDLDDRNGYHIYPAMQALHLDFLVPTGDTVYLDSENPRARTVELARYHWHRMYSLPRHIEFHRYVPGYWEVDDHDSWVNDCWPTMTARWMNPLTFEEGYGIYREQVPLGEDLYRTFRWGKGLQVWVVEGRVYRSPNNMPDGPGKSIWGEEQREWLMRTIRESDADFKVLVSPTPIVGPDRTNKNDNHSNRGFTWEGDLFRNWTAENDIGRFYVCCGDRHWQYMSIHPETMLREFSCGPASDVHAGGSPGENPEIQPFHRVKGGFLSVSVSQHDGVPEIAFRHHDVHGEVVHEFTDRPD